MANTSRNRAVALGAAPIDDRRNDAPHAADDRMDSRALQRRLVHAFEQGAPEAFPVTHYSPATRLLMLFGATALLWWTLYRLVEIALGQVG